METAPLSADALRSLVESVSIDEETVETFRRDGIVHLKQVLSPEQVESVRAAANEAVANPGPLAELIRADTNWENLYEQNGNGKGEEDKEGTGKKLSVDWESVEMFQDLEMHCRLPSFRRLVAELPCGGILARLAGSSRVCFFYDHLIIKRGGTKKEIPFHQDLPYWKVKDPNVFTAWIPLDPMPEEDAVEFVASSHRWGLFRPRHFVDQSDYEGVSDLPPMPDIKEMRAEGKAKALRFGVQPGDLLCFDARIVHGSPGNSQTDGQKQRRLALRFAGDGHTYVDHGRETAVPTEAVTNAAGLKTGDPLWSAPLFFPLVWPPEDAVKNEKRFAPPLVQKLQ
uniref:Phytanoyl-CoA dioxygenase n=1 Tax=Chromera velia CCMP2878 TaxID=1169474 RepID=A0A0G4FPP2_9ALVE|mmetsp:Transcript_35368/g.69806  ORF Transcript_35368/g.69806 Transcript_35368/m.69806 type:complete len:340 (+) Transcript_35368:182-1201(+)|eukprot:Cvel_18132.t1-p1 / transcript=Cvel_18132.t1 / gene=Cvel_18132 / organism=Chromera_velia_CCMP2878 / gene_product=hypothetical protein / transcript_product=hypothetical protein / location=Cvel_scaffold1488:13490-16925(+) / protein_length=339 / sequence_SO=supercontig / SO=protein_coding / is_pseudo=false